MIKKLLLSTLVFVSSIAAQNINVHFSFMIDGAQQNYSFVGDITTPMNKVESFINDDFIIDFLVTEHNEQNVIVNTNVYQKNDGVVSLIAQPEFATTFNSPAIIKIGSETNGTLSFTITVSHSEEL